jgi:O-antigen ligase
MLRLLTLQIRAPHLGLSDERLAALVAVFLLVGIVIVVPTPLNAGAVVTPLVALLALIHPILLPIGLVASVPVQDALPVPDGIPVTATRVMSMAAVVALPLVLIRRKWTLAWSRFPVLVLLLMSAMVISLWNATSLGAGYAELYRWLVALFSLILVLLFIKTPRQVLIAVIVVSLLATAQGSIGVFQSLLGFGPASFQIGTGFSRAFGTFGMPNSYAAYMEAVTLPLIPIGFWALGMFWKRLRNYQRTRLKGYLASAGDRRTLLISTTVLFTVGLGSVVGLAAIALSFSRGGWLGTLTAISVMLVLSGRRVVMSALAVGSVATLVLFLGASGAVLDVIEERFTQIAEQVQIGDIRGVPVTDDNFATVERMSHWQTAIAMWDEHPWIGVGAGNFDERFTEFAVHPQFNESQGHAHNYYLHLLAETGSMGLLAYLVLLCGTFVVGWRAYRSPDELARAIGIGAIGLSIALLLHNFFENLHVLNISVQMMLIWGLAIVTAKWERPGSEMEHRTDVSHGLLYDSRGVLSTHYLSAEHSSVREQH